MFAFVVVNAFPIVLFLVEVVAICYVRSKKSNDPIIESVPLSVRAARVMTSLTPAMVLPSCKSQLYSALLEAALADWLVDAAYWLEIIVPPDIAVAATSKSTLLKVVVS